MLTCLTFPTWKEMEDNVPAEQVVGMVDGELEPASQRGDQRGSEESLVDLVRAQNA